MLINRLIHLTSKLGKHLEPLTCLTAIIWISLSVTGCGSSEDIFEVGAGQSMLLTGKGPGQDAAINPFAGNPCVAIIENLSNADFKARVVHLEETKIFPVKEGQTVKVPLEAKSQLLLDALDTSKARVKFEKSAVVTE